jgi:Leucine-rich repeat (LRR) protein
MSGMNKGQTVIVVKGAGIGSKIFTTLIVLFVISLIVGIIGFGAYFAAPQAVGPILKKMGIPVEIPPVAKETPAPAASAQEQDGASNFAGITLTDDHIQSLRSTGLEFFKSSDGKGLQCIASVEPGLGLNDEDLPAIEVLAPKIVWLDLSKGNLTDLAVSRLSKIPNLRNLYLEDNKGITSRGVSGLSGLSKLKCLNLVGTSLDDSVVDALLGMTSLKEVYLWRSGLSAEALQKLREARPDMLVQAG